MYTLIARQRPRCVPGRSNGVIVMFIVINHTRKFKWKLTLASWLRFQLRRTGRYKTQRLKNSIYRLIDHILLPQIQCGIPHKGSAGTQCAPGMSCEALLERSGNGAALPQGFTMHGGVTNRVIPEWHKLKLILPSVGPIRNNSNVLQSI
jgi:hypothetical protein